MKICIDSVSIQWTVVLHDVHLYMEPTQMKYLFDITGHDNNKKYLIGINYEDFKDFIKECLEYGPNLLNLNDFEISIIQIIEKYSSIDLNSNLRLFLIKKLGNLILFNSQYKNFNYLKNLDKYFTSYSDFPTDNTNFKQSLQIKYLLILINNMIELKSNKIKIEHLVFHQQEPIHFLDFIYDFYLN